MRIHHLNCISSCPVGGAIMNGESDREIRGKLTCHCLLVETHRGLVLVDTGYGLRDVAEAPSRLSKFMLALMRPQLRADLTAYRQIEAMGFDPRDVRHIVLTHLDFDHAGGLDDFPWAHVHLMAEERVAAEAQRTVLDRMRYRPAQWGTRDQWVAYESSGGDRFFGFECVSELRGLEGVELGLVPLSGHTYGHAGVAVRTDHDWLLLAGDAYFHHAEMRAAPSCPAGLRLYQAVMEKDRRARLMNQRRLRMLRHEHDGHVTVACSHDTREFQALAGRSHATPAPRLPRERERQLVTPADARPMETRPRRAA